jgi:hypothetical protein
MAKHPLLTPEEPFSIPRSRDVVADAVKHASVEQILRSETANLTRNAEILTVVLLVAAGYTSRHAIKLNSPGGREALRKFVQDINQL